MTTTRPPGVLRRLEGLLEPFEIGLVSAVGRLACSDLQLPRHHCDLGLALAFDRGLRGKDFVPAILGADDMERHELKIAQAPAQVLRKVRALPLGGPVLAARWRAGIEKGAQLFELVQLVETTGLFPVAIGPVVVTRRDHHPAGQQAKNDLAACPQECRIAALLATLDVAVVNDHGDPLFAEILADVFQAFELCGAVVGHIAEDREGGGIGPCRTGSRDKTKRQEQR